MSTGGLMTAHIQIAVGDATVIVDVYETDTDETLDARVARAVGGAGRALGMSPWVEPEPETDALLRELVQGLADEWARACEEHRRTAIRMAGRERSRELSAARTFSRCAARLRDLIET